MRIQRKTASPEHAMRLQSDIEQVVHSRGVTGRICHGCDKRCTHCGSTSCQCTCSPECPDVSRALSSDPDGFPIEPGILGLVFAMTRTGLFGPCWSCEGHPAPDGSSWKSPGVWFFCDATVHVRLLADGVDRLANARRLNTRWAVSVTFSDPDNPRTTFALQPVPPADAIITLAQLQADATTIAGALPEVLATEGRALQRAARPALSLALSAAPGR